MHAWLGWKGNYMHICMLVFIWPVLIHASCFFKLTLNVFIDLCFILFFLQTFENGGNNHLFSDLTQQSHIHTQPLLCLMCTMYINRNRTPSKIHKIISLEFTFPSLDFYSRILCPFLLSRLRSSQFSALINFNLQLFMCSLTLCQRACVPTPTCETTTQNYHNENLKKKHNLFNCLLEKCLSDAAFYFRTYFSLSWPLFCHRIYAYQISINKKVNVWR